MLNRKTEELVQRFLDGDISAGDKEKVKELMKNDPTVMEYYEKIKELQELLYSDAKSTESVDLKVDILNKIHLMDMQEKQEQQVKEDTNIIEKLFPSRKLNIAYAVALGVIIGFLIFGPALWEKDTSLEDDLSGTIYDKDVRPAFKLPVKLSGVTANIDAHYLPENLIRITMDVNSAELSRTRLSFNKDNFHVRHMKVAGQDPAGRLHVSDASVEAINVDKNTYIILLKKLNQPEDQIKIEIFSGEQLLYEKTVTVNSNQ